MASKDRKPYSAEHLEANLEKIISLVIDANIQKGNERSDDSSESDEDLPLSHLVSQNVQTTIDSDVSDQDGQDDSNELHPFTFRDVPADTCVCVGFIDRWYPGFVVTVLSDDEAVVNFMHPVKTGLDCCCFQWPHHKDELQVSSKAVLCSKVDISPWGSSLRLWKMSVKAVQSITRTYLA